MQLPKKFEPTEPWLPAFEAVIQLAFIAPSLQITPSRRRPGPIVQPAWSCPMGHGRRRDQTQVLVEAWVPACAGMARKGNSRIVTMFVEANWVTASFAGKTRRGIPACRAPNARISGTCGGLSARQGQALGGVLGPNSESSSTLHWHQVDKSPVQHILPVTDRSARSPPPGNAAAAIGAPLPALLPARSGRKAMRPPEALVA